MSWWFVPDRCCCANTECSLCCDWGQSGGMRPDTLLASFVSPTLSFTRTLTGPNVTTSCCNAWVGSINGLYGCTGTSSRFLLGAITLCCPSNLSGNASAANYLLTVQWWNSNIMPNCTTATNVVSPTTYQCEPFRLVFTVPGPPYTVNLCGCSDWTATMNVTITRP